MPWSTPETILSFSVLTAILSQKLVKLKIVCAFGTGQTRRRVGRHVNHCTQFVAMKGKLSKFLSLKKKYCIFSYNLGVLRLIW